MHSLGPELKETDLPADMLVIDHFEKLSPN
jgi:hypothetical protein